MFKKSTLLVLALGSYILSSGQTSYGFKIGITQSKIEESLGSTSQNIQFKPGIQIGATAEIKLAKRLSLRPALQLTQKGFKAVEGNIEGPFYWQRNLSISYLELPVDIVYSLPVSRNSELFIGTGTAVSLGLFGKGTYVVKGTDDSGQLYTKETNDDQPFKKPGYKRMDWGVDFLAGIKVKSIVLTASYTHGLTNILNYEQEIQTSRNRSFALTIGYLFGK